MIARVGSMVAPFVLSLKEVNAAFPAIILGVLPLVGAALVLLLPETQGFVSIYFYHSSLCNNFIAIYLLILYCFLVI